MDLRSQRERMREWLSVGIRDGLTFPELAKRAGVHERTLRRWNQLFRRESAARTTPDREERAFVDLVELGEVHSSRIEIVLPGERRVVIDSTSVLEALIRLITAVERC